VTKIRNRKLIRVTSSNSGPSTNFAHTSHIHVHLSYVRHDTQRTEVVPINQSINQSEED